MKSVLTIILALAFLPKLSGQNFSLNGDALSVGPNCIAVTPNQAWQNGSVWYTDLLDLSQPFTLEFQMNYGTVDANGADGMMFVLQTMGPNALGDDGAGMGFQGFNPSFGIEFDTYYNSDLGDISADHIAFQKNGGINHYQSTNIAGPVNANPFGQNIEDGQEHPIKITWNPVARVVQLYFDCVLRLSAQVDLVNTIFNGTTQVWWGFTGATGGLSNAQLVCLAETYEFNDNLEYSICQGESIQISANGNPDGNYSWLPSAGLSNSMLQSPVAAPSTDTEYCYTYTDVCGNITNGCIQVNVITSPEVNAGDDGDFCAGNQFELQGACNQSDADIQWTNAAGDVISNGNQLNPSVSLPGTYTITATPLAGQCSSSDAVVINEVPLPAPTFASVLTKCVYDSVTLDVGSGWQSMLWFDGSTDATLIADSPGVFNVTIEENNCELNFAFEVIDILPPDLDLGDDQIFCEGESSTINATIEVVWNTGVTDDILSVTEPGYYSAEIEWQGCYNRDTIYVEEVVIPVVGAGEDGIYCQSNEFELNGTSDQVDVLYQWTLPDGTQTNLSYDPTQMVDVPGVYTLTAINQTTSCAGSDIIELVETPLPSANFDLLVEKCSYDSTTLDVGDNWQTVLWEDGSTASTWGVDLPGFYDVVIELNNCQSIVTIEVQDIIPPDLDLGENQTFCDGETAYIDASMVVTWNTGLNDAILPVSATGSYSAEVEWQGCYDRDTIYVEEVANPIVNAVDDGAYCVGGEFELSGISDQLDVLYQWTLPGGAQTAFTFDPIQSTDLPGVYTLTAVNQLTFCAGSDVVELTEIPLPVPDFDLFHQKCTYDEVLLDVGSNWQSIVWFDGSTGTTWVAQSEGIFLVTIEQLDCSNTVAIEVENIVPPAVDLGLDKEMCEGDSVLLDAGFPVEWQDGVVTSNRWALSEGEYYALSYLQGCFVGDSIYVDVIAPPQLDLITDTLLCEGSTMILQAYYTGVWNTGEVDNAILVDQPGTYTVLVTQGPCVAQDSVVVNMLLLPFVSIAEYDRYCDGESYELMALADYADYYSWSTGDTTATIVVSESSNVIVEVGNACGISIGSAEVLFEDCSALVYIPTSFTPNGDGINDEFWPVVSNVISFEIRVYDRWGRTVFHSNSADSPWLGNSSEGDYYVPNGQYNFRLNCTTEAGNAIERSGYITVIR